MGLGNADTAGGDVFIDGGSGGLLENAADVGFAEKEAFRQLFHSDGLPDILVDVSQNIFHLMAVFMLGFGEHGYVGIGERIDHGKELHEGTALQNVMGIAVGGGHLVDVIEKALLLGLGQGDLVLEAAASVGEAVIQIGLLRREPFYKVRVDAQHDALVELVVDLGQLMAFILVDDEQIPWGDGIEAVVYQELLPSGDGIVQLIAVMDMHIHGFFFFIEVGDGKCPGEIAVFDCGLAGCQFFHGEGLLFKVSCLCFSSESINLLSV